jgi:hypothetical protein
MSDFYKSKDPGDEPTTPLPVLGAGPGVPHGTGTGHRPWSRGKQVAAILGICAVVGGGTFAAVQAATGSPGTSQAAAQAATTQTGAPAGSVQAATGQAALLRDALAGKGPRRLARLRLLGGLYGQFTYETKQGARTLAFERGTITAIGGGDVVIRAANGTTWTWALTGTSVVRENGAKEPQNALAQGQAVFAGGPVTGGTRDARLIVIRKAATAATASGTA